MLNVNRGGGEHLILNVTPYATLNVATSLKRFGAARARGVTPSEHFDRATIGDHLP